VITENARREFAEGPLSATGPFEAARLFHIGAT
jgi:hypothetical protein